jgi:putative hydrolase of the HAD superfamily
LQHIKGIVFDLDDTLYPQEAFKRSGFAVVAGWVAKQYDFNPSLIITELEGIMRRKGASYPYMFDDLVGRLNMDKSNISLMVQVFIDHEPTINCYPGVHALLYRLRKKFKLGLLTDGRLAVQRRKIKALGLETEFDEILCSDRIGLEKPAKELYEWFEKKFKMSGKCLVYVGDNPNKDFYGANIQGWCSIMVNTGEIQKSAKPSVYNSKIEIPSINDLEKLTNSIKTEYLLA